MDGSFGNCHPEACDDGGAIVGTDEIAFRRAMRAEIPTLQKWLVEEQPRTLDILDMIEFCWRYVGESIQLGYHKSLHHSHLEFDTEIGRDKFCDNINRIFRRNGLACELTGQGRIERLAPPPLREELASAKFRTGDDKLNGMLEKALCKFLGVPTWRCVSKRWKRSGMHGSG